MVSFDLGEMLQSRRNSAFAATGTSASPSDPCDPVVASALEGTRQGHNESPFAANGSALRPSAVSVSPCDSAVIFDLAVSLAPSDNVMPSGCVRTLFPSAPWIASRSSAESSLAATAPEAEVPLAAGRSQALPALGRVAYVGAAASGSSQALPALAPVACVGIAVLSSLENPSRNRFASAAGQ